MLTKGARPVTDSRLKGRVKGLFAGANPDMELPEQAYALPEAHGHIDPDADGERQALQVLILARRTAEEHVLQAQREASGIRAEAQAKAAEFAKEAQAGAESTRRDAHKALSDAQAKAAEMARKAQADADSARREINKMMAEAQAKATDITRAAQVKADGLDQEAQQRYQEVVGSLEVKRVQLQQRIEALQHFDREYRARLTAFMESQLSALKLDDHPQWAGESDPEVEIDGVEPDKVETDKAETDEVERADGSGARGDGNRSPQARSGEPARPAGRQRGPAVEDSVDL
jgi:cell division septum initiation protein DivIVA